MKQFIRGLFADLHNKIEKMITHLNGITMHTPIGSRFKKDTVMLLEDVRGQLISSFSEEQLDIPNFIPNILSLYNNLSSQVMDIELVRYTAISKYNEKADGYFERLVARIYKEIELSHRVPFVSTFSNSDVYYWAETNIGMIALPQAEEKNLLNLSDLYHEIGHFIFDQHPQDLTGNMLSQIDGYFDAEKRKMIPEHAKVVKKWKTTWVEEFCCDLIATYLCGPAYAWTNVKITTERIGDVFGDAKFKTQHPAHEARMRAIFLMLEKTGFNAELKEVQDTWNELVANAGILQPPGYADVYPQSLIETLTLTVLEGCKNIALRCYEDQVRQLGKPVSLVVNQAWDNLRATPEKFRVLEEAMIKELGYIA